MKRIFISHSSRDSKIAMQLCNTLEENGCPCWIAPRDILYGEKWAEEIANNLINKTTLFVFILSENSNQSKQVLKEINIAVNYDIPMLILSIQQVKKLNLSLTYYLTNLHMYECFAAHGSLAIADMANIVLQKINNANVALHENRNEYAELSTKNVHNIKRIIPINIDNELNVKFKELLDTEKK